MQKKVGLVFVTVTATVLMVTYYVGHNPSTKTKDKVKKLSNQSCATGQVGHNRKDGMRKRLPQMIGIGCKKCGTAAFRHFLRFHSRVKTASCETHFFDDNYDKGVDYYKSLMPWTIATDITYEKTPKYIVTKWVPQRIKETYSKENVPTPKFVLVVCNPVQRAYSDFAKAKRKTGYRSSVVSPFATFDDYVDFALDQIERNAPPHDDVEAFYEHIPALEAVIELRFLTRGIYSYFLEEWYKHFPRKDIVIVDGDNLLVDPADEMVRAQRQLGLEVEIGPGQVVYDTKKQFYCVKHNITHNWCLVQSKGVTRKIVNGTVIQPQMPKYARLRLEEFYRPFNDRFRRVTSKETNWVRRISNKHPTSW